MKTLTPGRMFISSVLRWCFFWVVFFEGAIGIILLGFWEPKLIVKITNFMVKYTEGRV